MVFILRKTLKRCVAVPSVEEILKGAADSKKASEEADKKMKEAAKKEKKDVVVEETERVGFRARMKRAAKSLFSKTDEEEKTPQGGSAGSKADGKKSKKQKTVQFFAADKIIELLTAAEWDMEMAEANARAEYAKALSATLKEAVESGDKQISTEECDRLLEVSNNDVCIAFVMLSDQDAALKQIAEQQDRMKMVEKLQEINSKVTEAKALELLEESEFDIDSAVMALLEAQAEIEKENPDPSAPRLSGMMGSPFSPPAYTQQSAQPSPIQPAYAANPYLQPPPAAAYGQAPSAYTMPMQPMQPAYAMPMQPMPVQQMQPGMPMQYMAATPAGMPMQPGYVPMQLAPMGSMQYGVQQPTAQQGQKPPSGLYAPNANPYGAGA